jgi:arabinose-5-phosphate isomerase
MSTQKNSLLVSQVMLSIDRSPVIRERVIFKEALEAMSKWRLGIVCVVDDSSKLLGILTDGDLRRKLLSVQKPFSALFVDDVLEHAIKSPTTCKPDDTLVSAISLMEEKQIWDLPVVADNGDLIGLLHLHPAVQALLNLSN